jgi:hypothetical protein
MSNAISAQGTLIARKPAGSGVYTDIAELRDITPPPLTRNPIETTSHNELEESFVVGIRRKGELQFSLGFVPSLPSHDALVGLTKSWLDGAKDSWRITYPDGSVWIFDGYVTAIGAAAPVDDGLAADITIRPTGLMSFA